MNSEGKKIVNATFNTKKQHVTLYPRFAMNPCIRIEVENKELFEKMKSYTMEQWNEYIKL